MLPNQNNKLSTSSIVRQMPKIEIEIEPAEDEEMPESMEASEVELDEQEIVS